MKQLLFFVSALLLFLLLPGCGQASEAPGPGSLPELSQPEKAVQEVAAETAAPASKREFSPPEGLPLTLAAPEDLDGTGGYLLLGEIPEEDIALYCDNSEEREQAYLRRGEHFQAFSQKAWIDPTVLPALTWRDWDEDGAMDLVVEYLRHEGVFYDGQTTSPGLVCEMVVYQWTGDQWTDLHFYSGGGYKPES